MRSRRSKSAGFGTGRSATTPAPFPSGSESKASDTAPRAHHEGANRTPEHLPQVPAAFRRREAIYIVGRNNGKVLTHDVGLNKLLAGTLRLDPTGVWAMEDCLHPISEAGIGPLLDTLQTRWSSELDPSESVVAFRDDQTVGTRRCTMIETTHPHQRPSSCSIGSASSSTTSSDCRSTSRPMTGRPSPQAPAVMVEEYTYSDLRLNVGLSDLDFDASNGNYAFGRF